MAGSSRSGFETRIALVEAAEAVFARRGFEAASIREITILAGTALASVNYHFGDKGRLYRVVLTGVLETADRAARGEAAGDERALRHARILAWELVRPTGMIAAVTADRAATAAGVGTLLAAAAAAMTGPAP